MVQEEQLSVSKKESPNAILQFRLTRQFKYMNGELLEEDKKQLSQAIKQKNINSYGDLFTVSDKKFPADVSQTMGSYISDSEVNKIKLNQSEKEAQKRLSKYVTSGTKEQRPFDKFKFMMEVDLKGMDFATYQIRVGGVSEKNYSKFDDLYKEVTAFFKLLEEQYRPLNRLESEALETKLKSVQQELRKTKRIIESKDESFIQRKWFGYKSLGTAWFRDGVFDEFQNMENYLDKLIRINQNEQEFEANQPNDTQVLQYFYYLSWQMYHLLEEKLFTKKKTHDDFSKFTHTLLSRFILHQASKSWSKTKDSLRKNRSWQKLKRLNLHKIKTLKQYDLANRKLFT